MTSASSAFSQSPASDPEIPVEVVASDFVFPEGPVWIPEGYLLFSDVHGARIIRLNPDGSNETWFDCGKKTNGLILSPDGRKIYACCYSEREMLEIDLATRDWRVLARECGGRAFNNVNDVAVDAEGNLYFSDPLWGGPPEAVQGVYRVSPRDGSTTLAARLGQQPNGLVVSPDQRWLYVVRSGAKDVWRFERQPGGALVNGARWAEVEAEPDGMTVDSRGNLYIALAGDGTVIALTPEARPFLRVKVFDRMATNLEFQGGDERTLYVTGGGSREGRKGSVRRLRLPAPPAEAPR